MAEYNRYEALVTKLLDATGNNYHIEQKNNDIIVCIFNNEDKRQKFMDFTTLASSLDEGVKGYHIKIWYADEFPNGTSDIRKTIDLLTSALTGKVKIHRSMNTIQIDALEFQVNAISKAIYLQSTIFKLVTNTLFKRTENLKFDVLVTGKHFYFTITPENKMHVYICENLTPLEASIITYLAHQPKGQFYILNRRDFTDSASAFMIAMENLVLSDYLSVSDYSFSSESAFFEEGGNAPDIIIQETFNAKLNSR